MKFLKHMSENLFITLTGIAALVHSTWTLGTMFSGIAPEGDYWKLAGWLLPAFFVAFAMDVGQISTSAAIRHGGLTWQRGLTFLVFAVATYYLQFVYIAYHFPTLMIASGISDAHKENVQWLVDAGIWILPMLLPLATMLYTISDGDSKQEETKQEPMPLSEPKTIEIAAPIILEAETVLEPSYKAFCEDCGWEKTYDSEKTAARGLNTHQSLHCKANKHQEEVKISQNGHLGE